MFLRMSPLPLSNDKRLGGGGMEGCGGGGRMGWGGGGIGYGLVPGGGSR